MVMGVGERSRVTVTHHGSGLATVGQSVGLCARADVAHAAPLAVAEQLFKAALQPKAEKVSIPDIEKAVEAGGAVLPGGTAKFLAAIAAALPAGETTIARAEWVLAYVRAALGSEEPREYILELLELEPVQRGPVVRPVEEANAARKRSLEINAMPEVESPPAPRP